MLERTRCFVASAVLMACAAAPPGPPALDRYRALEFPAVPGNFEKGWRDRVALEFEIVNEAPLDSLRAALKDPDPFVRTMAARALGVRADAASAGALAELALGDPDPGVRTRAVEALGFLKAEADVLDRAKKDADRGVQWAAVLAREELDDPTDFAAQAREAYAEGIGPEEMASARVGGPAPDFAARTSDGRPFRLSEVLGRRAVALYFSAFDG